MTEQKARKPEGQTDTWKTKMIEQTAGKPDGRNDSTDNWKTGEPNRQLENRMTEQTAGKPEGRTDIWKTN